jgi:hypothetical protein
VIQCGRNDGRSYPPDGKPGGVPKISRLPTTFDWLKAIRATTRPTTVISRETAVVSNELNWSSMRCRSTVRTSLEVSHDS